MNDTHLYLAIGAPMLFNALLITLLVAYINAKISGLATSIDRRFESVDRRFDAVNQRFDDMRDLWRSELHRVEEVLDARLKHIEEERRP